MNWKTHEPYRGSKDDPSVRQPKKVPCAFCEKTFATTNDARAHEAKRHAKKLRALRLEAERRRQGFELPQLRGTR